MNTTNDVTLDFLVELVRDGLHQIQRECFRAIDHALLDAAAAEFGLTFQADAELQPASDRNVADEQCGAGKRPSKPGRVGRITPRQMIHELERLGFHRRKGSSGHQVFIHPENRGGHVTVPYHRRGLQRCTVQSIMRQAEAVLNAKLTIEKRRLVVQED